MFRIIRLVTIEKQRPGRPRDSRIDHSVLEATRNLLAETGYARLTVDAVAATAKVGKAAIYRRYGSKAALVFAAVVHGRELAPPTETGSLRGDLRALIHTAYGLLSSPASLEIGPAIIAEVAGDPQLAERFRQSVLEVERDHIATILDRALQRGELTTRPDPTIVNLMLTGSQFYALFGFQLPLTEDQLNQIADTVAAGLTSNHSPS